MTDQQKSYTLEQLRDIQRVYGTWLCGEEESQPSNLVSFNDIDQCDAKLRTELFREILDSTRDLPDAEKRELICRIQNGDDAALSELIDRCMGLVISLALAQAGKGISLIEMIDQGEKGLIDAILNFELELKTAFDTYARFYIKRDIESIISARAAYKGTERRRYEARAKLLLAEPHRPLAFPKARLLELLAGSQGAAVKDRLRAFHEFANGVPFTDGVKNSQGPSLKRAATKVGDGMGDHTSVRSRILTLAKALECRLIETEKTPGCRLRVMLTDAGLDLAAWIKNHPELLG